MKCLSIFFPYFSIDFLIFSDPIVEILCILGRVVYHGYKFKVNFWVCHLSFNFCFSGFAMNFLFYLIKLLLITDFKLTFQTHIWEM